ncbi:MAG: TonB family protein [Methylococcales bacterium]|nr:TonB family protein [Methylococcales bacterium]
MIESISNPYLQEKSRIFESSSIKLWVFIAALFHALLLLGVNFISPEPEKITKAIEITVVNSAVRKAPIEAHYLAQENQIGAGLKKEKPKPNQQQLPEIGAKKPVIGDVIRPPILEKRTPASQRIITKTDEAQTVASIPKKISEQVITESTKLTVKELEKKIARLGERIRYYRQSAEKTDVKFVNSISAYKYVAAEYVREWGRSIERIGNLNYPEVAADEGIAQELLMDVGIRTNGSIYNIRIVESSGNKALDEAAKQIVEMSAPFAPLPAKIAQQLDVLVIRRVWHFTDESGLYSETVKESELPKDESQKDVIEGNEIHSLF